MGSTFLVLLSAPVMTASLSAPGSTNVTTSNIFCGPGNGISVGSLGRYPSEEDAVGLVVRNCTFTGTANGVRIKTWEGSLLLVLHLVSILMI